MNGWIRGKETRMKLEPCPFCGADVTKIANVPLVDDCPTSDEWFIISDDYEFNFCPSCGCKIKGEENENNL